MAILWFVIDISMYTIFSNVVSEPYLVLIPSFC